MKKSVQFALITGASALATGELQAAVSYTNPGPHLVPGGSLGDLATYQHQTKQNFDTLPASPANASLGNSPAGWLDDSTSPGTGQFSLPGWYLYHPLTLTEGGANGHARFRAGTGSATPGAFWSFGNSADRALGLLNADTTTTPSNTDPPPATLEDQQMFAAIRLTNNSDRTLTEFTVQYTGEQWRRSGNNATTEKLDFQYSLDPTATVSSSSSLFTDVDTLDFAAPSNIGPAGAIDGNATGNNTAIGPITVTGISWTPGTDLLLRWTDLNMPGADSAARADAGLAIDNFGFSANGAPVPEPTGLALLALGAAGLLARRREG